MIINTRLGMHETLTGKCKHAEGNEDSSSREACTHTYTHMADQQVHAFIFITVYFISSVQSLYIMQEGGGCNLHVHDRVCICLV